MRRLSYDPLRTANPDETLAAQSAAATPIRARALSPMLLTILGEVRRELALDNPTKATHTVEEQRLFELIALQAQRVGVELTSLERDEVAAQIDRESRPFGILQDLVENPEVSDIIVTNFARVSVQISRRNIVTELSFANQEAYESFVERLLTLAGTTYSTKKPITDGMIGTYARIHAVHKSLCDGGPYLTVRLNRYSSVSVRDLIEAELAPAEIFSYLTGMVRGGFTILVAGEVGTGKTTLTRALAAEIPEQESILVIEDTPEIRLQHPHVRYVTTRESNSEGAGRVSPSELIRGGMRMAMNRIIFGEMRDAEAAESFIDVCASGHPGVSTIHSRNALEAMGRLELFLGRAQRGVTRSVALEQIASAVQVIVYVFMCPETGRRRIREIKEIGPVADGIIRQRDLFRYEVAGGKPQWKITSRISAHREILELPEIGVVLSAFPELLHLPPQLRRAVSPVSAEEG